NGETRWPNVTCWYANTWMALGACSMGRTWWAAMLRTARAIGVPDRLSRREGIPHPPRDSLSPLPHRRKKGKILEPDRSRANRTGHLDVLTITLDFCR